MNIIFLREGDARSRPVTLSGGRIAAGAFALFGLLPLLFGSLAFWLFAHRGSSASAGVAPDALGQIHRLAATSRADLTGLAASVGRLRARASRLDALSARLGTLAGLPAAAGSLPAAFATPPVLPSAGQGWTITELKALSEQLKTEFAQRSAQLAVLASILAAHRIAARMTPRGWPVRGGWISSPFGPRPDPFTGRPGFHPGIDIAAPLGTPVRAMAAGIVIFAGADGGFGRLVKISVGHSEVTMYAHLSARYVHVGEVIHKHELLGRVGDTGYSTGPHLHFEVTIHGAPINPARFLRLADRR